MKLNLISNPPTYTNNKDINVGDHTIVNRALHSCIENKAIKFRIMKRFELVAPTMQ